jgi:hypothetical protein
MSGDRLYNSIVEFSKTISNQELGLVYHRPDPSAIATNCFANVLSCIELHGGRIKFGWYFNSRISQFGEYIFATHHAVWLDGENGFLIDFTPFHQDKKHHPLTIEGNILFLLDDNAQPLKLRNLLIPLPLKFFAIAEEPSLKEYIYNLQEREYKFYRDVFNRRNI